MKKINLVVEWHGELHSLTASSPEQVAYEKVARVQKWPMPGADDMWPVTYMVFLAWSAMKRKGLIGSDVTWDDFSTNAEVDGEEREGADPTQPAQPSGNG